MHLERWRAVSAAMAIVAAASVPASARGRECAVEIRLQWVDVSALAPFAYPALAGEMNDILAAYGVCAEMVRASPSSVRTREEIAVILLRSMGGSGVGKRVLGATRSHDPRNATVWVYFDEVASALGLGGRPAQSWSGIERAVFGRALGRVAAHEIVHALLPQRPHDGAGLMSPSFGRRELTASTLDTHPGLLADMHGRGGNGGAEMLMDAGKPMERDALAAKALLLCPSCAVHGPRVVEAPSFDHGGRPSARTAGPPGETNQCRRSF